ncbi:MAG: hypothetical protein ACLUDU_17905 [Butyricimonas faecihominis]
MKDTNSYIAFLSGMLGCVRNARSRRLHPEIKQVLFVSSYHSEQIWEQVLNGVKAVGKDAL